MFHLLYNFVGYIVKSIGKILRGRLLNTYPGKCLPSHITLLYAYGKD